MKLRTALAPPPLAGDEDGFCGIKSAVLGLIFLFLPMLAWIQTWFGDPLRAGATGLLVCVLGYLCWKQFRDRARRRYYRQRERLRRGRRWPLEPGLRREPVSLQQRLHRH